MITFSVKNYFLWTPYSQVEFGRDTHSLEQLEEWENPALEFVDKKQQRRLNELSKIVLHSAIKCTTPDNRNFVTVLSSRNGDINHAVNILQDIANNDLVSPQVFVNSVLNMPFAYYSIFFGNNLPSSAVSSSESSLGYGFMEALLNLKRFPKNDILLTCAELPLNGDLKDYNETSYLPYSLSMIISGDNSAQNGISFNCERFNGEKKPDQVPDVLQFYHHFLNDKSDFFVSETSDYRFTWKRQIPLSEIF